MASLDRMEVDVNSSDGESSDDGSVSGSVLLG